MTQSVRYIRLTNGEEVIGVVEDDTDLSDNRPLLRVTDPLVIESYTDEENPMRRLVYMTRYAPFSAENAATFHRDVVVTYGPVSPVVARYYEVSREYCRVKTDAAFLSGIEETIDHVGTILSQTPDERPKRETRSINDVLSLAALAGFTSNTVN